MRVLFVSNAGIGHVFPMVPLAWELQASGHEVLVATSGPALAAERAGLAVVDVAPGFESAKHVARLLRDRPDAAARFRNLRGSKVRDMREVVEFLALVSAPLVDGAVDLARVWRPDLIVQSQIDPVGLLVAAKFGIPLVNHGFGFADTGKLSEAHRVGLAEAFDRHGVTGTPRPTVAIDVAPPSMTGGSRGWPMRYLPFNGGGRLPAWLFGAPERPRIAVTLGTVVPKRNGLEVVGPIIAAAKGLDVELVLVLGDDPDLSSLGPLPRYVRVAGWIPLNVLLRSCAGIVHHGGAGTTLAALDAGVPQLVLPNGADRYINAAAVAARGAGISPEEGVVAEAALARLLSDQALRAEAAAVRGEMRAMPLPASLIPSLVALAEPRDDHQTKQNGCPAGSA